MKYACSVWGRNWWNMEMRCCIVAFWITWQPTLIFYLLHVIHRCRKIIILKLHEFLCFKWARQCVREHFEDVCEWVRAWMFSLGFLWHFEKAQDKKEKYTRCQVVNENCIACRSGYCIQRVPFAHLLLSCVFCRRLRRCAFCCCCCFCMCALRAYNLCYSQHFTVQFYISLPLNIYDFRLHQKRQRISEMPAWNRRENEQTSGT